MKIALPGLLFILICSCVKAQEIDPKWYSEAKSNGVTIQNSFPKGGHYPGNHQANYHHSYLVFFTRVINETQSALEMTLHFSADSIAIPNSPNTYLKVFLPADTMTFAKQPLHSYGITDVASFNQPTTITRKLKPEEDCLFYIAVVFYQTNDDEWNQERGGNRAELMLKGQDLYYRMPPQMDLLPCGRINFGE